MSWAAALLLMAGPPPARSQTLAPIQDNSFLIEEAYNQEDGVVQHVSFFLRDLDGAWAYTFTQEWPVGTQRHQLSLTLPLASGPPAGLGDVALNYRLQLIGDGAAAVAVAPRLSLLLPTGGDQRGA
ncbi:MAG TPA: transporter, partial [Vicinamibacteria bacterium]|nr:transporter [Vicinamibacteria bacterium]